jgi:hypothetical protein
LKNSIDYAIDLITSEGKLLKAALKKVIPPEQDQFNVLD